MQISIEILDNQDTPDQEYVQYVNILESQLPAEVIAGLLRSIANDIEARNEKPKLNTTPYIAPKVPAQPNPYISPGIKPAIWADITTTNTAVATNAETYGEQPGK